MFCFFSSRRRHTRLTCDWSSDVCSSDLDPPCRPDARPAADRDSRSAAVAPRPAHRVQVRSAVRLPLSEMRRAPTARGERSEEHTSELQSHVNLVCRLLLEKKKKNTHKLN